MNYHEMEALFREEQLDLREELHLNATAVDLSGLKKSWLSVRATVIMHQLGGVAGYVYAGISLTLAYLNMHDVYLYGPLLLAAAVLLLNGALFPIRKPPLSGLERFTVRELADELAKFQSYASRRIPFDCLVATLFVVAVLVWRIHSVWGINPLTDFDRIGPVVRTQSAALLLIILLGGWLGHYFSNRKLRRLEERLRGYLEDEMYV